LKKVILYTYILLCTQFICAQVISLDNTIIISGKVVDIETNLPLEYATISFAQSGNDNIIGTTTDKNGLFEMKIAAGLYTISINYLSFQTYQFKSKLLTKDQDLGTLKIVPDNILDVVEITGEKKLIEYEINKKIYNASADIVNRGGNGLDVLSNTPSVNIDSEGNVNVRGSQVTILIDGKPQFNIDNDSDILKALPSSSIDKIEIITNSAKYSAEGSGAIVNIVTKKNRKNGLSGSISAFTGIPDYHGFSAFLNEKTKKLNLYATISYINENTIKEVEVEQPLLDLFQDAEQNWLRNTLLFNLGSDFNLNTTNVLSASILLNKNNKNNLFKIIENDFDRKTDDRNDSFKYEAFLGYTSKLDTLGQKLSIGFTYDLTQSDTKDDIVETTTDNVNIVDQQSTKNQQLNNFSAQLDYTLPFSPDKNLEVGYKGTFRTYENIFNAGQFDPVLNDFTTIYNLDDTFNYNENVHAFYGLQNAMHNNFSYTLGLRMEISTIITSLQSQTSITKNYTDFFPSLTLAYEINENSFLSLNYNRAIDRPDIAQLDPFITLVDERFQTIGNQNLNPYYTNYFELLFDTSFEKVTLASSFFLNFQKDQFLSIIQGTGLFANNGDQVFRRTTINSGDNQIIGLDLDVTYKPFKGLRLQVYVNPYRQEITNAMDSDYNNVNTVWYTSGNALISLNNGFKINLSHVHQSSINYGIAKLNSVNFSNVTISKDLFKNNGSLTFKATDVFRSKRFLYESLEVNTITNYNVFYRNKYSLTFTYNFNQKRKNRKDRSSDINKDDLEDKQDKKI